MKESPRQPWASVERRGVARGAAAGLGANGGRSLPTPGRRQALKSPLTRAAAHAPPGVKGPLCLRRRTAPARGFPRGAAERGPARLTRGCQALSETLPGAEQLQAARGKLSTRIREPPTPCEPPPLLLPLRPPAAGPP